MAADSLNADQIAFLDKCALEFSDRFTDSDVEYKQILDAKIPAPPIMCPWYGRPKLQGRRHGGGRNDRGDNYRDRSDNYRDRSENYRDRSENFRDRSDNYRDRYDRRDNNHRYNNYDRF